jgi:purine-binding chemotaxis protein CheW
MAYDDRDEDDSDDEQSLDNTYLLFSVAGESYALAVRYVTEIVRVQRVFSVPDVASYVRGVINLRGNVIPLHDVRARFGHLAASYDDRTVIVVIEFEGAPTGLIVDAVFDIAEYPPGTVTPPPPLSSHSDRDRLITGVARAGERLAFVLDVERLIDPRAGAPATATVVQPTSAPTAE